MEIKLGGTKLIKVGDRNYKIAYKYVCAGVTKLTIHNNTDFGILSIVSSAFFEGGTADSRRCDAMTFLKKELTKLSKGIDEQFRS